MPVAQKVEQLRERGRGRDRDRKTLGGGGDARPAMRCGCAERAQDAHSSPDSEILEVDTNKQVAHANPAARLQLFHGTPKRFFAIATSGSGWRCST